MSKFYNFIVSNTIMLSCSWDPDQDLQSGSKLLIVNISSYMMYPGGRGDYVRVVKFSWGEGVIIL